jgi:hypothetical protein
LVLDILDIIPSSISVFFPIQLDGGHRNSLPKMEGTLTSGALRALAAGALRSWIGRVTIINVRSMTVPNGL